jgi:protein SCO1/2
MQPTPNRTQWFLWTVLGVALLGAGIFALNGWMKEQELRSPTEQLPDYGAVPKFELTNQNGKHFTNANLQGHIWIADLIFTNCPGSCPIMTSKLLSIQKSLIKTPDVRLVSFSVDPDRDKPEVMKAYMKSYNIDSAQWDFVTGPRSQIYPLAKNGFHLPVDSVGGDQGSPIVHSERFVLVDSKGHVRGYFDGGSDEVQPKMLTAIGDLMREKGSTSK